MRHTIPVPALPRENRPREGGFTLVEIVISASVLLIALLGIVAGLVQSDRLVDSNESTNILKNAVHVAAGELRQGNFTNLVDEYGPLSGQDSFWILPDGSIQFTASNDAVGGGRFELFTDEAAIPSEFADLGFGFDLNGNGVIDTTPVLDYLMLPVRIRVTVPTREGPRQLILDLMMNSKT